MTYYLNGSDVERKELAVMMALDELESTTGSRFRLKPKSLIKFGRTANADDGTQTTVAEFQGSVVNETFATSNSIDSIVSSSGSDTETVTVEGHTVDGSGNLTFVVQTATLTGQTAVTLGTPLYRATRAYNAAGTFASPASDLVGNVYVYDATEATGITAGVPDVATATKVMIGAGRQQSEKCATAISQHDAWLITGISTGISRATGGTADVDIDVQIQESGGVFRNTPIEIELRTAATATLYVPCIPFLIAPPNSDIRMVATADTNDTVVSGAINGYLATKV